VIVIYGLVVRSRDPGSPLTRVQTKGTADSL
jgi:hypothetical protein